MNRTARWRMAAAGAVLAILALLTAVFTPIYIRNVRLQRFVATLPQRVEIQTKAGDPPSDGVVRAWVVDKARQLDLPVTAADVQVLRSPGAEKVRGIDVRYAVPVDLPGYTVRLHFYPGAGSR